MAGTIAFKAIENGTLSNPYRDIRAGQTVHLTPEEAEKYKKSSWLVSPKQANAAKEQPLMPHMGGANLSGKISALEAINQLPVPETYAAQMKVITDEEKRRDNTGSTETEQTETKPTETGTGNMNVLG